MRLKCRVRHTHNVRIRVCMLRANYFVRNAAAHGLKRSRSILDMLLSLTLIRVKVKHTTFVYLYFPYILRTARESFPSNLTLRVIPPKREVLRAGRTVKLEGKAPFYKRHIAATMIANDLTI